MGDTEIQIVIQRKLRLFGHICRMNDSRKIKTLVFGMMDVQTKEDGLTKNGQMTLSSGVGQLCRS